MPKKLTLVKNKSFKRSMRLGSLVRSWLAALALLAVLLPPAWAQQQRQLVVRVSGDLPPNATLRLSFGEGGPTLECQPVGGVCRLPVEGSLPSLTEVRTPPGYAVVAVRGDLSVSWTGDLQLWWAFRPSATVVLVPVSDGVAARVSVAPRLEGGSMVLELVVRRAGVVAVNLTQSVGGATLLALARGRAW